MHTALQAPPPAADPTPARSRWMPRLPLSEHPLALTLLVVLATLAITQLLAPAPARADLPVIGPLGGGATGPLGGGVTGLLGGVANDIFVKGFGTLLRFIFGNVLTALANTFLKDLLDVTPLSGPKAPAGLGQLHDVIDGAGWGLLTLSFTAAALGYWLSSYTSSGAQQAATAFARTVGAIGLLISSPYIFYAATEAVNQLTDAIITTPVVSGGTTQLFTGNLCWNSLLTQGGVGMIAALIAAVMALTLLLVKITITALLAVLYVLSPLAIGLWPVEQLSWLLRTLPAGRVHRADLPRPMGGLLRRVRCTCTNFSGSLGALFPLVGVAALIIAFKLPFAFLRISTGAGLDPVGRQGYEHDLSRPRPGGSMMSATAPRDLERAVSSSRGSRGDPLGPALPAARVRAARRRGRDRVRPVRFAAAGSVHLTVAIIIAGLPVVLSLVASNGELAPWTVTYALWRWWRSPKLYIPGANPVPGYHITKPIRAPASPARRWRSSSARTARGAAMSTTPAAQSAAPAAGDLLDVVALDRTGTLVRSDGTLVRYYELIPQNPEVLAEDQQEVIIDGLGQSARGSARRRNAADLRGRRANPAARAPHPAKAAAHRLPRQSARRSRLRLPRARRRLRADAAPPHDRQRRRPAADLPDRPVLTRERQRSRRLEEPAPRRPADQSSRRGLPRAEGARSGVPAGRGARRQRLPRARSARVHRDPAERRGGRRADLPAAEPVNDDPRADPTPPDHRRAGRDRRRRRSSRGRTAAPRAARRFADQLHRRPAGRDRGRPRADDLRLVGRRDDTAWLDARGDEARPPLRAEHARARHQPDRRAQERQPPLPPPVRTQRRRATTLPDTEPRPARAGAGGRRAARRHAQPQAHRDLRGVAVPGDPSSRDRTPTRCRSPKQRTVPRRRSRRPPRRPPSSARSCNRTCSSRRSRSPSTPAAGKRTLPADTSLATRPRACPCSGQAAAAHWRTARCRSSAPAGCRRSKGSTPGIACSSTG